MAAERTRPDAERVPRRALPLWVPNRDGNSHTDSQARARCADSALVCGNGLPAPALLRV